MLALCVIQSGGLCLERLWLFCPLGLFALSAPALIHGLTSSSYAR